MKETYGPWPLSGRITMAEWYYNLGTGIRTALNWKSPADFVQDFEGLNKESMRTKYHTFGVEYSGAPNDEYVQNYVQRADGTTLWGQKVYFLPLKKSTTK